MKNEFLQSPPQITHGAIKMHDKYKSYMKMVGDATKWAVLQQTLKSRVHDTKANLIALSIHHSHTTSIHSMYLNKYYSIYTNFVHIYQFSFFLSYLLN